MTLNRSHWYSILSYLLICTFLSPLSIPYSSLSLLFLSDFPQNHQDSKWIDLQSELLETLLEKGTVIHGNTQRTLTTFVFPLANLSVADLYKGNVEGDWKRREGVVCYIKKHIVLDILKREDNRRGGKAFFFKFVLFSLL